MEKCRYIVLTDINPSSLPWAEKDDIQSLVRLLLYANEIDIEGIIMCSSCFVKRGGGKWAASVVNRLLDAYKVVKQNLDKHNPGYPEAEALRSRVYLGISEYGKAPGKGFAADRYSANPGVQCIIDAVDRADERPVWIGLWGGGNTLAQAIWRVSQQRSEPELLAFLRKLRIHSICDQDNSGQWIRENFGDHLFYIVTPTPGSVSGSREYFRAVWPGISADSNGHGSEDGIHKGGFSGANTELISRQWLKKHIQSKGPLGSCYPGTVFIAEGDTPAFLRLIPNGLNAPEHPEYGSWSGRYRKVNAPENTPIWSGAADTVKGKDGILHTSPQASLWRWREDFQYDFAARMEWTTESDYDACSHPPIVRINSKDYLRVKPRQTIEIDASASESPDGAALTYRWYWYPEAGTQRIDVPIESADTESVSITFPELIGGKEYDQYHLILEVRGAREYALCRYKRIIICVIGADTV